MRLHARLEVSLDATLRLNIPTRRGMDGKKYYGTHFQFHAYYFSANCQVSMWFEGKDHGAVQITYI